MLPQRVVFRVTRGGCSPMLGCGPHDGGASNPLLSWRVPDHSDEGGEVHQPARSRGREGPHQVQIQTAGPTHQWTFVCQCFSTAVFYCLAHLCVVDGTTVLIPSCSSKNAVKNVATQRTHEGLDNLFYRIRAGPLRIRPRCACFLRQKVSNLALSCLTPESTNSARPRFVWS